MAKTKPLNIAKVVTDLDKETAELAGFDASFAELIGELQEKLGALDSMETRVDADIREIEKKGQEELAQDAVEAATALDQITNPQE